ncbi:MAG: hypothetical protein LKK51_03550 [Eubacterium sp.]|jgi:hypothetical protein|nr:hypothetical protein [Eubacterium sp.]MCI2197132.1 hypothetical protein [Eubacterium sp.]
MKKHRVYALLLVFAVLIAAITIIGAQLIGQIMPFDSSDLPAYHYDCKMLIDAILLGINILSDTLLFICGVKISQRDK